LSKYTNKTYEMKKISVLLKGLQKTFQTF